MANLQAKLPRSIQLNKPLILVLTGIFGVIILIALVNAFISPTPGTIKPIDKTPVNAPLINIDSLKQIPGDYSDQKGIAKYLGAHGIPPDVQKALDILRDEQNILQAKLAAKTTSINDGPQSDQARTSGLFFSGSSPDLNAARDADRALNKAASTDAKGDASVDSYALQNGQVQKLKFLMASDKPEDIYNPHKLSQPVSPFLVQAGTVIPGTMLTSINSSLPGNIVAQVRDDIYDTVTGQFILIPKGSKLMGQYDSQIAYGQERVLAAFTRVIRPDGSSILLDKLGGTDAIGNSGVAGDVDNHWSKILGAAVVSTVLSMGAGAVADQSANTNTNYQGSTQGAINGASGGISQTGQALTGKAINVQPTLTVPAGYQFDMIVNKDIILSPYGESTP